MGTGIWSGKPTYEAGKLIEQLEITLSADVAAAALPANFRGCYIFQLEISASADAAVTVTLTSALGNPFLTTTTSAATSASATNIVQPTAYYWIGEEEAATYTVSGLGAGTVTIKLTGVKK